VLSLKRFHFNISSLHYPIVLAYLLSCSLYSQRVVISVCSFAILHLPRLPLDSSCLPISCNHLSLLLEAYSSALVTKVGRFYEMSVKFNQTAELHLTFHKTKIFIITAKITSSFPSYSISVTMNLVMFLSQKPNVQQSEIC
jgi:hypothetical protein